MQRYCMLGFIVALAMATPRSTAADTMDAIYGSQPGDASSIDACIEREGRNATTCMHMIAKPCIGAAEEVRGRDALGIVQMQCWGREETAWDVLLNRAYARQMELAREIEAMPTSSIDPPDAVDTLRDAQRAWIAFRDAERARVWAL